MPDTSTLAAYDRLAADFAAEWHAQPAPADLHELVRQYFRPGRTADIGCGSGRECAWLAQNGYETVGFDASDGLIAEARRRYPALRFERAALPALDGVAPDSFTNVLCETVIMHLDPSLIGPSVRRLADILEAGGTLYLSWRVTDGADRRDEHGRLYAAFDPAVVIDSLSPAEILLDERRVSASSGKAVHRVVARKR